MALASVWGTLSCFLVEFNYIFFYTLPSRNESEAFGADPSKACLQHGFVFLCFGKLEPQ